MFLFLTPVDRISVVYSFSIVKENLTKFVKEESLRADRLLSILLLLQARGRMTARELAERLEVSERTIYRDLDALSSAGVPIYAERGPSGGCELLDGYQTKLNGLTELEVRALFLLSVSGPLVDLGLGKALEDALLKLSTALPAPYLGKP
jgi:predicted DNA-binding transcriptional regulator YafY